MPDIGCRASTGSELDAQVRAIESMSLSELREAWRNSWGAPPKLRSVELLRLIIAWRLQAMAEGGLDRQTRARIRGKRLPRIPSPPVGTRLTREYRGVLYSAEIEAGGVRYAGRRYGSLSEVAREITGTRWNGPRFFGLRGASAL